MKRSLLEFLREQERERQDTEHSGSLGIIRRLNKEREERKLRDRLLERVRLRWSPREKGGTLIMGARCRDGIVIGSDRKVLRGGETEYSNKIFDIDLGGKVLFAAEGLTGIRDDFFLLLDYEIRRRRGVDTLYEVKVIVEDIISDLTQRYKERLQEAAPIGVLMGGLESLTNGEATVYYIHSQGYGELTSFVCTGHGGSYGASLAKFLCGPHLLPNLLVDEVAKRIAFTILWVAEEVDSTVGGLPQVMILKHKMPDLESLSQEVLEQLQEKVKKCRGNLPALFEL